MIRQLIRYLTTSIPYLGLCGFLVLGITEVYGAEGFPEHRPRESSVPGSSSAPTSSSSTSHDLTPDTTHSDGTISCESSVEDHEIDGSAVEQRSIGHTLEHIRQFLTGKEFNPKAINDFTSALEATATVLELPMDWEFLDAVVRRLEEGPIPQKPSKDSADRGLQDDFYSFVLNTLSLEEMLKKVEEAGMTSVRVALWKAKIYSMYDPRNDDDKLRSKKDAVELLDNLRMDEEILRELNAKDFKDIAEIYEKYLDSLWLWALKAPEERLSREEELFKLEMARTLQYFYCYTLSSKLGRIFDDLLMTQERFDAYQQLLKYGRMAGLTTIYTFGPVQILTTTGESPLFSRKGYQDFKARIDAEPSTSFSAEALWSMGLIFERGGAPYLGRELGDWGVKPNPEEAFRFYQLAYEKLKDSNIVSQRINRNQPFSKDVIAVLNNLALEYKKKGTLDNFQQEVREFLKRPLLDDDPLIKYNIGRGV